MQLLFLFDRDMKVKKTFIQTLANKFLLTLMQLLLSFDQDMRVEKTLIQTLACQLSSTLKQLLFSFDQDVGVEKTLIQFLARQLSFNFCLQYLTSAREFRQLSSNFIQILLESFLSKENSHANSCFANLIQFSFKQGTRLGC